MITALGISNNTSKSTLYNVLFGVGQGATDSPPGWMFYTNMLTTLYNKTVGGSNTRNHTNKITVCRNMDMIVDDATLNHTNTFDMDADLLQTQTHRVISIWGENLGVTGGLLEYTKTKYTMLIWKFCSDGKPAIMKEKEFPKT
eukprot:3168902-Ditylum_brightwellii.AAC.1